MRAGKIAAIAMIGLFAAATFAAQLALHAWSGAEQIDFARALTSSLVSSLTLAIFVLPLGVLFDRSMNRIGDYIERVGSSEKNVIYLGSRLFRPVVEVFTQSVEAHRRREQLLSQQLREIEIKLLVAEAAKRQVGAALNSLRDAVIVTDAYCEIAMANEAAARIFEFDLEEAQHHPLLEMVSDDAFCRHVRDTLDSSNVADRRHIEHEVVDPRGSEYGKRIFDVTLACIENHRHEVAGVVAVMHDLTHERELAQRETDFVSKASHELRTPLSSISAYVEMLVDGEAADEKARHEFYHIIQNETDRLGRLIDNMLNLSRIEAGIVQIDREIVDMRALIDRALHTLEPQAREKQISLHTKISPVDLRVEGDSDMLYQVILNLASNSVKYTPDGGRVTVSADTDNLTRTVLVSVADTGLGIPPDSLPKLFEKFYRVDNYKRVAKGTGLGLSLCKHIVETVHHGQIGVESKLGMGSRFWFAVPMRYAGSQAAA